ncbi:MAG: hypothetical protein ABI238_03095 [Terrimesophilobacter sp.]
MPTTSPGGTNMVAHVIKFMGIIVATTMMLTGCVFSFGPDPAHPAVDSQLYLGPIPSPAPLPSLSDVPRAPTPPADFNDEAAMDEYLVAIEKYAQEMQDSTSAEGDIMAFTSAVHALADTAKRGGAESVAAWQSLLVAAGIAVNGPDGKPLELNGKSGAGWPVTDPELRILALMGTSHDGIRLTELGSLLNTIPEFENMDVASALYDDLLVFAAADHAFSTVLNSLNPEFLYRDYRVVPKDDVVVTWGQVGLILRRLSVEILMAGGENSAAWAALPADRIQTVAFAAPSLPSADKEACDIASGNPWGDEWVKASYKGFGKGYDKTIEPFLKAGTKAAIGIARLVAAFVSVVVKALALEADFAMSDSPLVRTKDVQPGQIRDLTITFEFKSGKWTELAGCLNRLLGFAGFEIPVAPRGPVKDVTLDLQTTRPGLVRIGDGKGGNTSATRKKTDKNGQVAYKLTGAPQTDLIPEHATPDLKSVTLHAESNLESNDLFQDLFAFPWAALDAVSTLGLSLIPSMLSKLKILMHTGIVDVQDWKLEADFEVTAVGSISLHEASNIAGSAGGCGSGFAYSRSIDGTSTFASDPVEVTAQLVSNPQGNVGDQAVVFLNSEQEYAAWASSSGALMFNLTGHYDTVKSASDPATGNVPPVKVLPPSKGCGDGNPNYTPPAPDCGPQSYTGQLDVVVPAARTMHLQGKRFQGLQLWKSCGSSFFVSDPPVAVDFAACDSSHKTGGQFPSTAKVYDPKVKNFDVSGSMNCSTSKDGHLRELEYNWTLVFCRIEDGKSAC